MSNNSFLKEISVGAVSIYPIYGHGHLSYEWDWKKYLWIWTMTTNSSISFLRNNCERSKNSIIYIHYSPPLLFSPMPIYHKWDEKTARAMIDRLDFLKLAFLKELSCKSVKSWQCRVSIPRNWFGKVSYWLNGILR